jgi:hypothetical protein
MCLADRFLVWAGHEAESLAVPQIHVCGVTENPELLGGFLERGELLEELFLSEFPRWETAFALVVSVDEIFHVDAPFAPLGLTYIV